MAKLYITSAFSGSMLPEKGKLEWREVPLQEVNHLLFQMSEVHFSIGHASTASLLSNLFGVEITPKREMIKVSSGDRVLVFQLMVRLAEGQVLSLSEINQLFEQGKAKFILFSIY